MANVKFIKIKADSTGVIKTYVDGAIYFDEKSNQIKLGNGTDTPTSYGGKIANVTFTDNVLTIEYCDGKTKPIVLDFSDIASASETMKVFDEIKSRLDKLEEGGLSEDIAVAGGPLADDVLNDTWPTGWTNADGAKIIPAGKTLEEILEGLFLKVVDGTVSFSYSAWNPVLGNPTAKLSPAATQEVNASITPTAGGNSTVTGNSVTATGKATQGYFLTTDGAWKSENYTQTINGSITSSPAISSTWNGAAWTGGAVKCIEGTNTFKVVNANCHVKMGNYAAQTIYASTNTKKCLPTVSAVLDVDANAGEKVISSQATATVVAYYPVYTNGVNSSTTDTTAPTVTATADATKLPLVANGTAFGVAFAAMVVGGTGYRLLLRSGKKISSAKKLNGLTAKYDIDVTKSFVKNTTAITKQSGGVNETYYAWEYKGTDGANRVIFTIANE